MRCRADGAPYDIVTAIARRIASGLLGSFNFIAFCTHQARAPHDMLVGTVVVNDELQI